MKKKLVYGVLAIAAFALFGCGNTTEPTQSEAVEEVVTISTDTEVEETVEEDTTITEEAPEITQEAPGMELGVAPGAEDDAAVAPIGELSAGSFSAADMTLTANGVAIKVGDDFLPNVDKVGSAEIVEGQACLDGGFDTNYYYGGEELVVYTVAKAGKQVVYDIYITSANYPTAKGAVVGKTTKDELYELYGDPTETVGATQKFSAGGTVTMNFTFGSDGVLESIDIIDNAVNG